MNENVISFTVENTLTVGIMAAILFFGIQFVRSRIMPVEEE